MKMDAEMICDRCGEEIYSGESHYFLNGQAVCISCMSGILMSCWL